jgi:hypothetical protein
VQLNLNKVLQDIGMVTRVEGVAVAEHRDSNLVEAVPVLRHRARANRHYPPDTPPAQQAKNSGSEHLSPPFGLGALSHASSCRQFPHLPPPFLATAAGAPQMAHSLFFASEKLIPLVL